MGSHFGQMQLHLTHTGDLSDMHYHNPVISGFHPDPSICRVGEDYYLVTSSFEYFPGVPLFHSRDLVHWRQIGHCLTRASQLLLHQARASGGIYAPTIRYHHGVFYMITTNVTGGGHFYVHTRDPFGAWSEPVWIQGEGIDPSLFFDEDERVYFTHTGPAGISQHEIDLATGQVGEARMIWEGTGGQYPEGPHLYRINGVYYLLISEGGTEYGHMLTVARSASPWGPFESCPANPILSHRSTSSPIQATGHGDFVQDPAGNWWVVFLGIRPNGHWSCHHLGRETFLAPVAWTAEGWPAPGRLAHQGPALHEVHSAEQVALEMEGPDLAPHSWPAKAPRDDFNAPAFGLSWNFLRNPRPEDASLSERKGWLSLKGSAVSLNEADSPAWVGCRQEHFEVNVTAKMEFGPGADNEEAGLVVWMNERHHYEVAVTQREGRLVALVRRRIGSLIAEVAKHEIAPGPITLELTADRNLYAFALQTAQGLRIELAQAETKYLATEVAGGFTGVYFALYATGNGAPCASPAFFDWFEYRSLG
jgi:xylan 1,4-beta-xylosidase